MAQSFERNQIIRALPAPDRAKLLSEVALVTLASGAILSNPGETGAYVYFPISGLVTLLLPLRNDRAIEVGFVDSDGFLGRSASLSSQPAPHRAVVLAPGEAVQIDTGRFWEAERAGTALHALLYRALYAALGQAHQLAACNGSHSVTQRCSRVLLLAIDTTDARELPLTRTFLAFLLSVRRASVTAALGAMERAGILATSPAGISIRDRPALESMACECYERLRSIAARSPNA